MTNDPMRDPIAGEPRPTSEDFEPLKSKTAGRSWSEEINLAGNQLVDEVKRLTHQGNIRSIKLKHDGKVIVELPLTAAAGVGAVAVLAAPQLVILGAIAGAIAHLTVEIEHSGEPPADRLSKL